MKLYAVHYGSGYKYGTRGSVFKNCDYPEELVDDFIFLYYIAEVDGKLIYIDTGFRDEIFASERDITLNQVEEEIREVFGEQRADVVIITHTHWDHVNNLDLYDGARIIVATNAYQTMREYQHTSKSVKEMNWDSFVKVENTLVVENTFKFEVIGGHAPDSSIVLFQINDANGNLKKYVLTGDECYVKENMDLQIPVGTFVNADKNIVFLERMKSEGRIPLTFHDRRILFNGEKITEHIVRVI